MDRSKKRNRRLSHLENHLANLLVSVIVTTVEYYFNHTTTKELMYAMFFNGGMCLNWLEVCH